jgi:hypothetical protein
MTTATTSPAGQAVHQQRRAEQQAQTQVTFTVHVQIDEFPIDVSFAGSVDLLVATVKRLRQLGAVPPPRPVASFGGPRAAKPLAQPRYNDDGTPCCTHHTQRNGQPTPLRFIGPKDGRPGFWGCPSQAQQSPGETINSRGYCDLRFDVKE